jgi:hypothetical protein
MGYETLVEGDPLLRMEGLTIMGDVVLGGWITTCGHFVNDIFFCIF